MKNFYSHIINLESIFIELDELELSEKQKTELADLIDSNLHSNILDIILKELNQEDKRIFLQNLKKDDHQKIWDHLNSKVDSLEKKIEINIEKIKEDLHKDIMEAKKRK